jgi:hypothetical protein
VVAELPLSLFLTGLLGATTHLLTHPAAAECAGGGEGQSTHARTPQWVGFVGILALLWQVRRRVPTAVRLRVKENTCVIGI